MDFSTENGMLRGNTFFPFFFHLSPNSHRSGRISNESYSAVFKYFDLQFPPSTNCEGAGRISDASVLHCRVVETKFSIRNFGPDLRRPLRFYLGDCHSDDSGPVPDPAQKFTNVLFSSVFEYFELYDST